MPKKLDVQQFFLEMRQAEDGEVYLSLRSLLKALDGEFKDDKSDSIRLLKELLEQTKVAFASMKIMASKPGETH